MKLFKKNQIIIYVIVLMLMTAGYLNYTTNSKKQTSVETSMQLESKDDTKLADIGDATLVNSNDVATQNTTNEAKTTNSVKDETNTNNVMLEDDETSEETALQTSSANSNDYFVKSKMEREAI